MAADVAARVGRSIGAVFWFVREAAVVGGFGLIYFLVPLSILVGIMLWRRPLWVQTRGPRALLALPLPWIAVALWGGWFWLQIGDPANPRWTSYVVPAAPAAEIILLALLIWRMRGARIFTAAFGLINLYFTFACSLLAYMAIRGIWL